MRTLGFLAASGAGLLAVLRAARAQSLVSQGTLSAGGSNPYGAGYANGHVYFCSGGSGLVWKVATGNANGPSSAAPSEVNAVTISGACYDGVVDKDGIGYWAEFVSPIKIAKTNGNAGSAPMTLVGEYTIPGTTSSEKGSSIALDEVNNILYVGGTTMIFKLDAGGPSALPSLLNSFTLDAGDGEDVFGLAVDPATGYGYAGTGSGATNIVKFSLGAGQGAMTRIGRVAVPHDIYGLQQNSLTGVIYAGYYPGAPDAQMFLPGAGNALPTLVGDINFNGAAAGGGIYTNKAFVVSGECNYLFAGTASYPGMVDFFDLGTGTAVPAYKGEVALPGDFTVAGAVDQYGYSYFTLYYDSPVVVYKISPPQCANSNTQGGPFTLAGAKSPAKRPAKAGGHFKVTFSLTRWAAGYIEPAPVRRELAGLAAAKNKTEMWENFDVLLTLPAQGATLHGKPRVAPRIPKRKGADVANSTLIAWNAVPMKVLPGTHKNYTRKFTFGVKVDKAFAGSNLTFAAAAAGPQDGWFRTTTLTVPILAAAHK